MKCRHCAQNAAIHMRQHHLALCKTHFLDWMLAQTQRFIQKYALFAPGARLLLAVSGGKDSLALWDILTHLGYAADGLYIHLGIAGPDDYSNRSQQCCLDFAAARGLRLHIVDVARDLGCSVPDLAARTHRGRQRPCSVCGLVKRHLFNQVAAQGGYDVLLTGHNLDDEASVLFGNTLTWSLDLLRRQAPVLPAAGFVRKAKPLCRFYERETAAYAILRPIVYVEEECPFAAGNQMLAQKALLNQMESQRPGLKLQFYTGFLRARPELFSAPSAPQTPDERCPRCDQPTTAPGLCAFCRLIESR